MENDQNLIILQLYETFAVLLPVFLEIRVIIIFCVTYIQEQEELMKKKYGGLVKKKPPLIAKVIILGFTSILWCFKLLSSMYFEFYFNSCPY